MTELVVPNGWVVKKLGEVCYTTSGGTPSRKIEEYYNGSIPWVKSGELDKGVIFRTEEYITEQAINNSSAKIFPTGTLLIALYGATIGKLGFLGVDAATNQAVCGIFKNDITSLNFLAHYLFYSRNKLIEQGAGGAQPNISQTILKELNIPLPPLAEQHRIVAKIEELFSELDKGVETLKSAQAQLQVYRQAVLKYAFEGKLTNPGLKDGELPEGWVVEVSSKINDIRDGTHDTPKYVNSNGVPLITSKNLKTGKIDFTNVSYISKRDHDEIAKRSGVEAGDILFAMIGTIGNPVVISTGLPFSIKNVGLFRKKSPENKL